ncbi:MAG: hypothetical protein II808_03050 [Clostridia bacterium]|nr:hypothetical protein [Clostridia bacterium]
MDDLNSMLEGLLSDPKNVEMLKGIAASLQSGAEKPAEAPAAPSAPDLSGLSEMASLLSSVDPAVLSRITSLLGAANVDGKKTELLNAVRPYLSPEKSGRVDGAIRMMKIMKIAGALGINTDIFGRR